LTCYSGVYVHLSLVERPTDSNTQVRRTWGPNSLQKRDKIQHRQLSSPTTNGWVRWSRSAPNLPKTLSFMGDHSLIKAFTDLGSFFCGKNVPILQLFTLCP